MSRPTLQLASLLLLGLAGCTDKTTPVDPDPGTPTADLAVTAGANTATPADGDTVTVTIQVSHAGGSNAANATGVSVGHRVGGGATVVGSNTASGTFNAASGIWSVGSLSIGANAVLSLEVEIPVGAGGATIIDSVGVGGASPADLNRGNDSSTVVLQVQPRPIDISLTRSADTSAVNVGDSVTFVLSLVNHGPGPASGIEVLDSLPSAFVSLDQVVSAGSLSGDSLWTIPLVEEGDTATWSITATADVSGAGTSPSAKSGMTAVQQADTLAENDTTSVAVAINAPDVFVSMSASDTSPADGDTVQIGITVTNGSAAGAIDVTGLEVTNLTNGAATILGTTASAGSFDGGSGLWTIGALAVGDSATLSLDAAITVGAGGSSVSDSAWVSALDQGMVNTANDTAVVALTVQPRSVDIEVLKAVDDAQPLPDSTATFTVRVVNNGPGPVSNVTIFDTLAADLTAPDHFVSVGEVVGDSLWLIPLLSQGDTATWTTGVTVAPDVGGGSATNTALLRALDQADTLAANDTASVSVTFPVSTLPVVTIDAPADSTTFDPGELVTLVGTASDAEDGPLSAAIEWSSSLDGVLGSGASFGTDSLSTGVHRLYATVVDSDGGSAVDSIVATIALYSVPVTLNVPFSGTASLPITLSEPAPTGGVTLDVTSDDPSITAAIAPTVFIPAGSQSANATLEGLLPGTTDVRVSNPLYGTVSSQVSVTAELDIARTSFTLGSEFEDDITITFESQGSPISAPTGGLAVTLTPDDGTCVSAPNQITIPQGQISTTAAVTYGGIATLPCTSFLRASSGTVTPDSVEVTIVEPPTIALGTRTVAAGHQTSTTYTLGVANHGGIDLVLRSSDASLFQVAPDNGTLGTDSIIVSVPDGSSVGTFWLQGVEGATGTPQIEAIAPGFAFGSANVTVLQPGLSLTSSLSSATTTLSPDDPFLAVAGYPSGNSVIPQQVRPGSPPVQVTFTSSAPAVAVVADSSGSGASRVADIAAGATNTPTTVANGGVALDPLDVGVTTVSASAPGYIQQPNAVVDVTVTAPDITVGARTVGSGLESSSTFTLGATGHGGVDVVVRSDDPTTLLIAPDGDTPGTDSIIVAIADGTSLGSYFVQGVEGATGTPTVTVYSPGFNDGTNTITVVQPGIIISNLATSITTLSPDDPFWAVVGYPSGSGVVSQQVRAGGTPVSATFTSSDGGVGLLVDTAGAAVSRTVEIPVGATNSPTSVAAGGAAHVPQSAGVTTISVAAAGFATVPNSSFDVTVTAPDIVVSPRTVGSGLMTTSNVQLLGSDHGGVDVIIRSDDPSVVQVAPDNATAGADSIIVSVPDGSTLVTFWVHGVEAATGTPTVTAIAPGFNTGSATMTIVQPGLTISGLSSSTTTISPDDAFIAQVGFPSGNGVVGQSIRSGGSPITVTFATDDTGVGVLTDLLGSGSSRTIDIAVGTSFTPSTVALGGVAHDPVGAGTANITAVAAETVEQPNATVAVTVSAPGITVASRTVGGGLQTGSFFTLGSSNHGGIDVVVKSSDPSTVQVALTGTSAGADSVIVSVPNGASTGAFWVHGMDGTTGIPTVSATAPGFTDGSGTITVVQPGITIVQLAANNTVGGADDPFRAVVGYPAGLGVVSQNVRTGGNPVTVTFTSSDGAIGQLTTTGGTDTTRTAVVAVGNVGTPTTVAAGGVAFDPIAAGIVTVNASATGFVQTSGATVDVTINP